MSSTGEVSERRKWQRLPLPVPVFIRGEDEKGRKFLEFTAVANIGAGGALLVTRRYLHNSTKISLEIPPPAYPTQQAFGRSTKNLKAKVISVRQTGGFNLCGLEFSRPLTIN